ncbi:GerAB/ArcD/ProY family transporter [Ectobacillus antri]|uniref:GerAB/ArcD/ProY family transporter n=1 Tax=Ectobacillus antri TaxID=2486280 RepID=A0ABT6H1N5_9BACI|nr:GerAB/ArcD/ProY family transporter [Ectobacillus antri]MDG4655988.1 GerAB/ArcD/ProY family transporter [Ectobacillus antri]MDG5752663.1 GerAB/ArcD/ProY family transporter [Ectobacillus antri]
MQSKIKENMVISAFLVPFIVHSAQVGVGVLGFQAEISKLVGQDAWIVVGLTGILFHIIVYMIYGIFNGDSVEFVHIMQKTFGSILSSILNVVIMGYFILLSIVLIRTYISVVQLWMFPDLATWIPGFLYMLMIYYVLSGGFRTVTGICFFGVIIPMGLFLTLAVPLKLEFYFFRNLSPIMDHSAFEFIKATKEITFSYLGIEALLVFYPFIKGKSQKWAHLGVAMTTCLYLYVVIITTVLFNVNQLDNTPWATLTIWKFVEFPFVERFEYIGVVMWSLVMFPNVCLYIWSATRMGKQLFHIKQQKLLIGILAIAFISVCIIQSPPQIKWLQTNVSLVGLGITYMLIPLLYMIGLLKKKMG